MESYTITEQEKKQALREFQEAVRSFPPESERKEIILDSLNNILKALGCYLNDSKTEFKRETVGDKEFIVYSSTYGTEKQSITGDSPKALFEDSLKLLLKHCRELDGSIDVINNYFNDMGN